MSKPQIISDKNKKSLNIKNLLTKIINSNKPEFVNILIKPDQKIIPKLQFGKPIEDLSPLLNRKEFLKNMQIEEISSDSNLIEIN